MSRDPTAVDQFPADFTWGAATSAYQIEGSPRADGKGESIWDRFVLAPGRIRDGDRGDVACDHYRRSAGDVALMRRLGLNAYRFSIAWTRIQPTGRGRPNERGLGFYDRLVDGLLEAGVEPWVTLYHWDLPQVLEDRGGWPARGTADAFEVYADVVSRRLGDRVRHWMTVNEPWEIGFMGYVEGKHAPGRRSLADGLQAIHVVLVAHGRAARAIRANRSESSVGIAVDLVSCYPDRDTDADRAAARLMDSHFNRWFLDPLVRGHYPADLWAAYGSAVPDVRAGDLATIAAPLDFVGLNYYYSAWVRATAARSPLPARVVAPRTVDRTGLGWAVHEAGFEDALRLLAAEYGAQRIVVSESGAAYPDRAGAAGRVLDMSRARYHQRYLAALSRTLQAGVPVVGYFAWSLLDNFEWQLGYRPRFGLIRVDHRTQVRTIKLSGAWYGEVARANRLLPLPASIRTPRSQR